MKDKKIEEKKEGKIPDIENMQKIIADEIIKDKSYLYEAAYNLARGLAAGGLFNSLKSITLEYTTQASKLKVEISMKETPFITGIVEKPSEKAT